MQAASAPPTCGHILVARTSAENAAKKQTREIERERERERKSESEKERERERKRERARERGSARRRSVVASNSANTGAASVACTKAVAAEHRCNWRKKAQSRPHGSMQLCTWSCFVAWHLPARQETCRQTGTCAERDCQSHPGGPRTAECRCATRQHPFMSVKVSIGHGSANELVPTATAANPIHVHLAGLIQAGAMHKLRT